MASGASFQGDRQQMNGHRWAMSRISQVILYMVLFTLLDVPSVTLRRIVFSTEQSAAITDYIPDIAHREYTYDQLLDHHGTQAKLGVDKS